MRIVVRTLIVLTPMAMIGAGLYLIHPPLAVVSIGSLILFDLMIWAKENESAGKRGDDV